MSDMTCPTVKIKTKDGYTIINAEDFDSLCHERFIDAPPPPPAAILPPPPPPPVDPLAVLTKDWRNKEPKELRTLAASVTGRTPEDKKQAIEMIEQALAKRG